MKKYYSLLFHGLLLHLVDWPSEVPALAQGHAVLNGQVLVVPVHLDVHVVAALEADHAGAAASVGHDAVIPAGRHGTREPKK